MQKNSTDETPQAEAISKPSNSPKVSCLPWLALVGVLAICAGWFGLVMMNTEKVEDRITKKVIMPPGYTGAVKIVYGIKGEAALEQEGEFLIVNIPLSGEVKTSTRMEYGQAVDEFYRVLPGKSNVENAEQELERLDFSWVKVHKAGFVGDENEYAETSDELKLRDPATVEFYEANREEAKKKMTAGDNDVGIPTYEIFLIRSDLE